MKFFTGLPSNLYFEWVYSLIQHKLKKVTKKLSNFDHLLVVFLKLKLALYNKDIAYRFGVSSAVISKVYRGRLPIVAESL